MSSPPSRWAAWRPTSTTSTSRTNTASASAWAIRSARAASSAGCAPSRCCWTSARIWTSLRPRGAADQLFNPMAINCWAVSPAAGRPHVGLCHSVQGTCEMLARWIGAPYDEVRYPVRRHQPSGVVHRVRLEGAGRLSAAARGHQRPEICAATSRCASIYYEAFRLFRHRVQRPRLGIRALFPQDSRNDRERAATPVQEPPRHLAEFWRARAATHHCQAPAARLPGRRAGPNRRHQGPARHPDSTSTAPPSSRPWRPTSPRSSMAMCPTTGLITNLPQGCAVEVPCLVDANGIQPCYVGDLPTRVGGAQPHQHQRPGVGRGGQPGGRPGKDRPCLMLDPLTSAVCTLPQIRSMAAELFAAEARWLPQFS